ncbi:hypothetical protein E8E14_011820 [Neopestalotiopsis sp. 37M]|nr:hypothetical protein E8E14_011820 [Neopestalotiopsis sp. 37M]
MSSSRMKRWFKRNKDRMGLHPKPVAGTADVIDASPQRDHDPEPLSSEVRGPGEAAAGVRVLTISRPQDGLDISAADEQTSASSLREDGGLSPATELDFSKKLWIQAYEKLSNENPKLIAAFETILSQALIIKEGDDPDITTDAPNLMSSCSIDMKMVKMREVAQKSLDRAHRHSETKDILLKTSNYLKSLKEAVGIVLQANPVAGLAWSGICSVLPILMKPIAEEKAMVDGLVYVVSRLDWYMNLVHVVFQHDAGLNTGNCDRLRTTMESSICKLYMSLLQYQVQSACYYHHYHSIVRGLRAVITLDDWENRLKELKTLETEVKDDMVHFANSETLKKLGSIEISARVLADSLHQLEQISQSQMRIQEEQDIRAHETIRLRQNTQIGLFKTTDYETRMRINPDHVPGTCEWFCNHETFQTWLDDDSSRALLVSADPGCGKSTLSRYLVEIMLPRRMPGVTIAYFFFKDNEEQRGLTTALCALLHQIFQQNRRAIVNVEDQITTAGEKITKDASILWKLLTQATANAHSKEVVCILDALDECEPQGLQTLVNNLSSMRQNQAPTSRSKLRFLATTRGYPEILDQFSDLQTDCIQLSGDSKREKDQIQTEIKLVMDHNIKELSRKKKLTIEKQIIIRNALLRQSSEQKTYLWLQLVFEVLEQNFKNTSAEWERLIEHLPPTVDRAYEKLLRGVAETDANSVRVLLELTLAAHRPFTLHEMNVAIHVREHIGASSEDDIDLAPDDDFRRWLIHTCRSFVTIYDDKVYFIHQTVKEFLMAQSSETDGDKDMWRHSISLCKAHSTMAESCIAYLSLQNFRESPRLVDGDIVRTESLIIVPVEMNPPGVSGLWDYVVCEWTKHYTSCQISRESAVYDIGRAFVRAYLNLFDLKSNGIWGQGTFNDVGITVMWWNPDFLDGEGTALKYDHARLLQHMMRKRMELQPGANSELQEYHNNLLVRAAKYRAVWCTKLILGHSFVDAGSNPSGMNIFVQGHQDGNPRSQQSELDDHVNVIPLGEAHNEAFITAVGKGSIEITRLLLERGVDVNFRNEFGQTALSEAIQNHHTAILELLLEKGADVNIPEHDDYTHLTSAVIRDRMGVAKLLIANGADLNFRNETGQTALHYAARGHRVRLERQPYITLHNETGETALHYSARVWNTDMVKMLILKGADLNIRNDTGETALYQAIGEGNMEMIELILANGVDLTNKSSTGQTALHKAVHCGDTRTAIMLLAKKANFNVLDDNGMTILHEASIHGNAEIVQLLLEKGSDVTTTDVFGQTPLQYAVEYGHPNVEQLLLVKGDHDGGEKSQVSETAIRIQNLD